jgi:hypothetical protein
MLQSGDDINLSELEQELRGVKADFGPWPIIANLL